MNRTNIFLFVFFSLFYNWAAISQGLINNGAIIILNSGPNIYIDGGANGGFTNESGGSVEVNTAGTITLEGDLTNNDAGGIFPNCLTDPGTVIFNGSGAQSIGGTSAINFSNLTLDNSSGLSLGVTLNVKSNVYTALTLTNGVLNTVAILQLMDGATTTIGNAGSYIDGSFKYTMALNGTRTLNLPLGKGNDWRPAVLIPTHSAATSHSYTAELFNADAQGLGFTKPATITHVSYVHYYTITRDNTTDFTSATLRIYYSNTDGFNDGVTDAANLGMAKDNGSGSWVDITSGGGSANNVGNILSAAYTPQNTYFTLANKTGGTNPLPVDLLNFTGECAGSEKTILKWTTATEINNAFFTIEKSLNGVDYRAIATIPGAGNNNTIKNYSYTDNFSSSGDVYYRLIQTDNNGDNRVYSPITLNCKNETSIDISVFPNPSKGKFYLSVSGINDEPLQVTITDILGRELYYNIFTTGANNNQFEINPETQLAPGTYMLTINVDKKYLNKKIIIN